MRSVTIREVRDVEGARRALRMFAVMAVVAGLAMFVLIAEMVLKYGFDNEALTWWSPVHGLIFMVFVFTVANLGFKIGWSFGRMAAIVVGACVPLVAFWIERVVHREVETVLADAGR